MTSMHELPAHFFGPHRLYRTIAIARQPLLIDPALQSGVPWELSPPEPCRFVTVLVRPRLRLRSARYPEGPHRIADGPPGEIFWKVSLLCLRSRDGWSTCPCSEDI